MSLAYELSVKYNVSRKQRRLTLAIKMRPPEIRQNEATSSEGGLEAKTDVGGEIKNRM